MSHKPVPFSPYQKLVVAILAFLQFTIILDFMILSPLGAVLMPELQITPAQFGVVVSAYAFSAGISGILAAGFADQYDRKKFLMFFYIGFVVGTLLCGIANSYEALLFARIITGIFGGVVGAVVSAIVVDLFPFEMRGRVMGVIQTAFAGSQVLGLPLGMFLCAHWGWHAPFLLIVGLSAVAGVVIGMKLQPINEHLKIPTEKNAFQHLMATLTNTKFIPAFFITALISIGGFMIMPFSSAFTVNNMGIPVAELPSIYLITGLSALFIGPIVGRLSDRYGKFETFAVGSVLSVIMVLIYTQRGITPLSQVMLINIVLFMGIFSRMIPSQALISAIPEPRNRGAFMSISSSLQQITGGFAAVIAGMIVTQEPSGTILHFERVGYVMSGTATVALVLMYFFIHKRIHEKKL